MKKIILLIIIQSLSAQYFLEDYEFIWDYDEIGKVAIKVNKTPLNTSIMICENKTGPYAYSTCMKILPQDAISFADILSKVNSYYSKFKNEENDISEEIKFQYQSASGELTFTKSLSRGFRVKLYISEIYESMYFTRKEADYVSKSLKDSKKIVDFLNKQLNSCVD